MGWLPALNALNLPLPHRLIAHSAMMLRAEFPVHRNRTANSRWAIDARAHALVFAQHADTGAAATVFASLPQHAPAGATVFGWLAGRKSSP